LPAACGKCRRWGERPDLSAAVLDFGLKDGVTGALCEHLNARGFPFVVYTGYRQVTATELQKLPPEKRLALANRMEHDRSQYE
jgi:hypothetical protein